MQQWKMNILSLTALLRIWQYARPRVSRKKQGVVCGSANDPKWILRAFEQGTNLAELQRLQSRQEANLWLLLYTSQIQHVTLVLKGHGAIKDVGHTLSCETEIDKLLRAVAEDTDERRARIIHVCPDMCKSSSEDERADKRKHRPRRCL
jgi:hypothetical protein